MKKDDTFWKKHQEYFFSVFESNEQPLHVEKLTSEDTISHACYLLCLAGMTAFIYWLCFFVRKHLWLPALMTFILLMTTCIFWTSGILSSKHAVITSKAIYYCRGRDCDLVFRCRYCDVERISILKHAIILSSIKKHTSFFFPFGAPNGAPLLGRLEFFMNCLRRIKKRPSRRRMFDFTKLNVLEQTGAPRHYLLTIDLKNNSEIPKCIEDIAKEFSHITLNN